MQGRIVALGYAVSTLVSACSSGAEPSASAGLAVVKPSQAGSVTQTIADAEIRVVYNRPVARGRDLFGTLVKWGEAWNPGADQATRIEISRDIRFAGHRVPAGSYSVWVIPDPAEWTLILSNAWDVYHVPYPGESEDALRFAIRPKTAPHMETLGFYFPSVDGRSGVLALHWGETLVEIPLEVPQMSAE